jgi:hypothetical protein
MNEIILSLGGIARIHGSCQSDATDEQIAAFLDAIEYVHGREKITVAQARERQAQVAAETAFREKEARSIDALRYLASTDWYVVRQQETGKAIPVEVLAERQQARDSIE